MILLVVMVAIEAGGDPMRLLLRYDQAAVTRGEWYRLLTAHFVHLGINHLLLNLAGILLFFFLFIRTISVLEITLTILIYAVLISLAMHLGGTIGWYVGFSGVLYGLFVFGVIHDPKATLAARSLMVILMLAKVLYDLLFGGDPALAEFTGGEVISLAHLYGMVLALIHRGCLWIASARFAGRVSHS